MFFRIGSYEFFIEPAPQYSFFETDSVKNTAIDREVWVLGHRIVISRVGPRFPRSRLTA